MSKKTTNPRIFINPKAFEREREARVRLINEYSLEVEDFAKIEAEVKTRIASRKKVISEARERICKINEKIRKRKDARRKD